jgi:hypothetical protein
MASDKGIRPQEVEIRDNSISAATHPMSPVSWHQPVRAETRVRTGNVDLDDYFVRPPTFQLAY